MLIHPLLLLLSRLPLGTRPLLVHDPHNRIENNTKTKLYHLVVYFFDLFFSHFITIRKEFCLTRKFLICYASRFIHKYESAVINLNLWTLKVLLLFSIFNFEWRRHFKTLVLTEASISIILRKFPATVHFYFFLDFKSCKDNFLKHRYWLQNGITINLREFTETTTLRTKTNLY